MRHIVALSLVGTVLALTVSTALAVGPVVEGSVTQKFTHSDGDDDYLIAVDGTPYAVPLDFYARVHVGNTVRFDGTNWTILK